MKKQTGLTLIEMVIALIVISVMLAIGIPRTQNFIADSRVMNQARGVHTALAAARAEAIRRGRFLRVCGSSDMADCDGDWPAGYILFVDGAANAGDAPVVQEVLFEQPGPGPDTILMAGSNFFRFRPNGLLAGGAPLQISFWREGCGTNGRRDVLAAAGGRASVRLVDCS